ncbi:uncharacterized protein LOC132206256 [Stegostoma tigrinum]|uniref:uncharacterized protein LOC132206256 n=1 Tax=Stegostoma tigrinum TaxID=3053191 RepID=UPI00287005F3|nr:uncharacterized protein LOC132206256 [Stegostoma tigrinum]
MGCNWSQLCGDPSSDPEPIVVPSPTAGTLPPVASVQPVTRGYREPSNGHDPQSIANWLLYGSQGYREVSQEEEEEEEDWSDLVRESGWQGKKNDEHLFFETFFLVLHRVRGYQGTLQRWRNDLQRARREGTHILDWPYIWRKDGIGYLQTLRLVQELVQDEPFTPADLVKLEASARRVVKQRKKEYHHAQLRGKSNSNHQKVLQTWVKVVETLEYHIC